MRKLLIGCGVVVGLCVLAVVIGMLAVRSWIGNTFPKDMKQTHAQLEERYGPPEKYVPPLDGVPAADRVARFVTLRENLKPQREAAAGRLTSFIEQTSRMRDAERPIVTKVTELVSTVRGGSAMAAAVAQYLGGRDQALLDAEMGEGEYRYLYGLAHFAYLGWEPLADSTAAAQLRKLDTDLTGDIEGARSRIGRLLRQQFENQKRALEAKPARTPAEDAALAALRAELAAAHSDAFPFVGRLPPAWAAPLAPYRDRLLATLPRQALEVGLDVMKFESKGKHHIEIN